MVRVAAVMETEVVARVVAARAAEEAAVVVAERR